MGHIYVCACVHARARVWVCVCTLTRYVFTDLLLCFFQTLSRFFDQISSVRTLMDLLYENKQHDRVLATMDVVRDKQIDGMRFPMDCVTLTAASCFQLVS